MHFVQYYLDCLSQASYLHGDEGTGRAVVVDPRRDVEIYLDDADAHGLRIERVIETHIHADFLSGHLELAAKTGAAISYGEGADVDFPIEPLRDGEQLRLGDVTLQVMATPGHTPESVSVVVRERPDDAVPYGVLTGDTMFIGDVGRPDLLSGSGVAPDELARLLYRSLHEKLLALPDATRVFPAHGAGSACGKNLSTELSSTIGVQKATNYAVRAPDKETFVALVSEGQAPAPEYFLFDAVLNRQDHELLDESRMPDAVDYDAAMAAIDAGVMLVDGRNPEEFAQGHLRGAINVGLEGRYAEFAGSVIAPDVDILLVTEPGQELEGKNRLARIGFDRVVGYLDQPYKVMFKHRDDVEVASRLTVVAFEERRASVPDLQIVDVRNPAEVADGTIPGAVAIPVRQLVHELDDLDPSKPTVVYCAGGYRSSVAASVLRQRGFDDVSDIVGGYAAWAATH